jgi:hypothetical protein
LEQEMQAAAVFRLKHSGISGGIYRRVNTSDPFHVFFNVKKA